MNRLFCLGWVWMGIAVSVVVLTYPQSTHYYLIEVNGKIPTDLGSQIAAAGGKLLRVHPQIGVAEAASSEPNFAAVMRTSPKVRAVEFDPVVDWSPDPNMIAETLQLEGESGHLWMPDPASAPLYPCQWNLHNIDAAGAWAMGAFGHPSVKVAVLDSGIDPTHVDLVGKVDLQQSTSLLTPGTSPCNLMLNLPDEESFQDFRFHGTFVASQIVSNSFGIAAVAPWTRVVGVKVLNCGGQGRLGDIIAGILYAADLTDVDVINMSLGTSFPKSGPFGGRLVAIMNQTVNYATRNGKLVVSAAGNDAVNMDHDGNMAWVPAQSGAGIAVYATTWNDSLASYSNFGISSTWVGAPGGDLPPPEVPLPGCFLAPATQGRVLGACSSSSIFFNCQGGNSYLVGTGTSFAAPIVSGVAALIDGLAWGKLNSGQLKTILKNSADDLGLPGADAFYSHGRVNAARAVE